MLARISPTDGLRALPGSIHEQFFFGEHGLDVAWPSGTDDRSATTWLKVYDPAGFYAAQTATGMVCNVVEYRFVRLSVAAVNNAACIHALRVATQAWTAVHYNNHQFIE